MGVFDSSLKLVKPLYKVVKLTPGAPAPTGTDITNSYGGAIVASDLTIRNSAEHWFYIPMAASGYRSLAIMLMQNATAWDQAPIVRLWAGMETGATYRHGLGSILFAATGIVTASARMTIGAGAVGTGGYAGTTPVPATFYHFSVPSILDGWPLIALAIGFTVAPTQGQYDEIWIARQG
jgi:hypothetical protein